MIGGYGFYPKIIQAKDSEIPQNQIRPSTFWRHGGKSEGIASSTFLACAGCKNFIQISQNYC